MRLRPTISGHMKLFQCVTTVISSSVTSVGRDSGTTSRPRMLHVPAPSMRIASISSCGICRNCSRNKNTAYGDANTNGSTSPANVPTRSTRANMKYSGMTVTTCGTISVANNIQNSSSRPGKRSRANA